MRKISVILCLLISTLGTSQIITPEVQSPAGDFFTTANFTLSFTVGEIAIIETYTGSNFILTQGFQQPDTNFTTGSDVPFGFGMDFQLYPNPGTDNINLYLNAPIEGELDIQLFDILSQQLITRKVYCNKGINSFSFDVSTFANGVYFMNIATSSNGVETAMTFSSMKFIISK